MMMLVWHDFLLGNSYLFLEMSSIFPLFTNICLTNLSRMQIVQCIIESQKTSVERIIVPALRWRRYCFIFRSTVSSLAWSSFSTSFLKGRVLLSSPPPFLSENFVKFYLSGRGWERYGVWHLVLSSNIERN